MINHTAKLLWGFLLVMAATAEAVGEEAPFFRAEPQYPNAFIIFDNSDSMQDVPYLDVNGLAVRPSGRRWRENVTLNDDKRVTGWANVVWPDVLDELDENANPTRRASGGNHPSSKLYQAKLALNVILNNITEVNLGLATYMSQRDPRVVAKYYRIVPEVPGSTTDDPIYWQVLELADSLSRDDRTVYSSTSGSFSFCSQTFSGLGVGDTFAVPRTCAQSSPPDPTGCSLRTETITYTISEAGVPEYRDGVIYRYRWKFYAFYQRYRLVTINDPTDSYDPSVVPDGTWHTSYPPLGGPNNLPPPSSGYTRVTEGTGCRLWRKYDPPPVTTGGTPAYYTTTWLQTNGDWSKAPGQAGYIDPVTLEVTPTATSGLWTLVPEEGIHGVVCNTYGTICDIEPARYPSDYIWYSGRSSSSRPHAWSYVRKDASGNWAMTSQPPIGPPEPGPYFYPAEVGNEGGNRIGDDHLVFVNLPTGNDTTGANKLAIKNYVSLERFSSHPRYTDYDYTTMPFTSSIAPNTGQAESWPSGGGGKATPLAASLRWAKRYFESYIRQDAQSLIYCRQNFIILLTDGLDTADCDPAAEDYNTCLTSPTDPRSPVAAALALRNILIDEQPYEVKTYVIGFGLDPTQAATLNDIAEAGGTGRARFAQDAEELAAELSEIFQEIGSGFYTRSDLTISREGDRIYMAYFEYPGWRGHLAKFSVDADSGNIKRCESGDTSCVEWGGTGDAGSALKAQSTRVVYTTVEDGPTPTRITFGEGNLSALKPHLLLTTDDINGNGTPYEDSDAQAVIGFTLDPGFSEGGYAGTRDPSWKLADLYHTRPVVVGKPPFNFPFNEYPTFKSTYGERDTTVYVGSNGGMLHAFRARHYSECDSDTPGTELCDDNGEERWSYIPKMALPQLKQLRIQHEFYVDSPPTVSDVYSAGTGGTVFPDAGWYTVLVSGMREGGRGYFALDVTDPDNPRILWEYTDTHGDNNMGYTWSVPAIGRVKVGNADKWVAIVGGGWIDPTLSSNDNIGNRLYMIDIETGQLLRSGSNDAEWTIGGPTNRVPSSIRAVDMDGNGYIEKIYFGDTSGVMWKMDLTDTNMGNWVPCKLFDPEAPNWHSDITSPPTLMARPIFHPPAVARADSGYNLLFFGTGDEISPTSTGTQDYFFEVEDRGDLVSGSPASCTGTVNWVIQLPLGEKVLSRPAVFNRVVYFTSYSPSGQCGAGTGYLWGVTMSEGVQSTGGGQAGIKYDESGNELENPIMKREIGAGVPTAPLVTNGNIYVTTSNLPHNPLEGEPPIVIQRVPPLSGAIRGWREVF